jgi:murein DD-endopeptidase MepM/ murein hydrolase activator NlpD
MVVAAVAAGAFAAATAGQALQGTAAEPEDVSLASAQGAYGAHGVGGDQPAVAPVLVTTSNTSDASSEVRKLTNSQQVTKSRLKAEAEAARKAREEAARPDFVAPAEGSLTSGFGARWGTTHYGIDIANAIGTPIYSVADGTVIEAGPASGFGQWVRIQHDDGTVTVYGHMYTYSVAEGQRVEAGQQIAEIGNNGQSTGPHLHFEVWQGEDGAKIDPLSWLSANGVNL